MRILQAAVWPLVLATLCGCHESSPPRAFRVKGRLFVDDQMAGKACIAFHPIDQIKSQGRCPVAMTRPDGSFELTTYSMHDGAPEGEYKVTVTWPDDSMPVDECECVAPLRHDRLSGKYADPQKTSLSVTILPQQNQINLCVQGAKQTGMRGFALPWNTADGEQ